MYVHHEEGRAERTGRKFEYTSRANRVDLCEIVKVTVFLTFVERAGKMNFATDDRVILR